MTLDHITHVTEFVAVLLACWRMVRAANRIVDVLKDFPPHRHVGSRILYPKGFEPALMELKTRE